MTTPSRPICLAPVKSPKSWRRLGLTWSCNSRANLDYDTIKSFKDSGLRLFLVGYESGNEEILKRIKKGVTMEEMRRFTKSCHKAGVVIHGTFILGLPVETQQASKTRFVSPRNWMCSACRFRLAAPYPGTELFEMARQNGWFVEERQNRPGRKGRFPAKRPGISRLSKDEIFEAVDRFYRAYYLRPKPILRIIKTMLEDKDVCVRRCAKVSSSSRACASAKSI